MLKFLADSFDCLEAENGQQGYELAASKFPDVVLADLEMPVKDGLGLLKAMHADTRTKAIPVIMMTTVMAVERVNECRAEGCAGFVLKPVQQEYLMAKLRHLVGSKGAATR
jgi:two-component system chemotaxis response regulator CheY